MSTTKQLKLLQSIFQKILTEPDEAKYRNLNFDKIRQRLNNSADCLNWLYNAGFAKSNDNKRLIMNTSNTDELRKVYASLLLIMQSIHPSITSNTIQLLKEYTKPLRPKPFNTQLLFQSSQFKNRIQYGCNLDECLPLIIIGNILSKYQVYIENKQVSECKENVTIHDIYNSIGNNYNSTDILDDFNHLLLHHSHQFEDIYSILRIIVYDGNTCTLSKCLLFRRNTRDRHNISNLELKDLYFNQDDINQQQLIDRVHCYFFHTFDVGYKLTESDKSKIFKCEFVESKDADIDCDFNVASSNKTIQSQIIKKDESNISKISCHKHEKFIKDSNAFYKYGQRFYYWQHYKNNSLYGDDAYSEPTNTLIRPCPIYKTCNRKTVPLKYWYISAKYTSLKTELLNNELCKISLTQWQQLNTKALIHLNTFKVKSIYCPRGYSAGCYEMVFGQIMSDGHLIALMIYCNYDVLQFKFTETFRKVNNTESDSDLKKRHSNYYWLGRRLRECVECFGMDGRGIYEIKVYHGINKAFMFPSLDAFIMGPFSTTTEYTVAVNFAANSGVIMELRYCAHEWVMKVNETKDAKSRICCFDCSWISDFSNESEIFCIGGLNEFSINNIIEVENAINYEFYIKGIQQMTRAAAKENYHVGYASGRKAVAGAETSNEVQMVFRLLSHQLWKYKPHHPLSLQLKGCPEYIDKLLNSHCDSINAVRLYPLRPIRFRWCHVDYYSLFDTFFLKDGTNGIDFDVITTIFPNVNALWYFWTLDHLTTKHLANIFQGILCYISDTPQTSLTEMMIKFDIKFLSLIQDIMSKMTGLFWAKGWGTIINKLDSDIYKQAGANMFAEFDVYRELGRVDEKYISNSIKETKRVNEGVFVYFLKTEVMEKNMFGIIRNFLNIV